MKRVSHFLLAAVFLLSLLTGCGTSDTLSIGTAGIGGNYYVFGNALAQLLEEDGITLQVKSTAGSASNLQLMNDGFLQLAIVQSDMLRDADTGNGTFSGTPLTGYSAVASLYTECVQIITSADSDIQSVSDLIGKKVSIGSEYSGVQLNAQKILDACGISSDQVQTCSLSFTESAAALADDEIDAFFCTAGTPTTAVAELARQMRIRFLSLEKSTIQSILSTYSGYSECIIPAGTYYGQEDAVSTIGVKAVLAASDKLSSEQVYTILSALMEHADALQYATSARFDISLEFAASAVPIPFHPGAVTYYLENGYDVSENYGGDNGYGLQNTSD